MIDASEPTVRIVLRPDRRQSPERRAVSRGGRRLSDWVAFAISSGIADHNQAAALDARLARRPVSGRIVH